VAGVLRHFQVIKDKPHFAGKLSHFLSNTASACGLDKRNSETPQPGDVFRPMSGADTTAVFIIIPIDDVMAAIFNAPVSPIDGKNGLGIGLLGCLAGDAIGDFSRALAGFLLSDLTFNTEYLADMRECEVSVQFCGSPDSSDFDSAVIRGRTRGKFWFFTVLEEEGDVV